MGLPEPHRPNHQDENVGLAGEFTGTSKWAPETLSPGGRGQGEGALSAATRTQFIENASGREGKVALSAKRKAPYQLFLGPSVPATVQTLTSSLSPALSLPLAWTTVLSLFGVSFQRSPWVSVENRARSKANHPLLPSVHSGCLARTIH